MGHGRDVPVATTSRDPNAGQAQQQATGATADAKLSRTELNVLKTMITVIACFMIFWATPAFTNLLQSFGVSILCLTRSVVVVAKKADRTAYDVGYSCRSEPPKMPRLDSHDHLTALPMAIPDAEISAVQFFAVRCG